MENHWGCFPLVKFLLKDGKLMVDKPWEEGAIKVIRKAQVPVVPIYFHAKKQSVIFLLSKISGTFRTANSFGSV
jgi:hypothetical protein